MTTSLPEVDRPTALITGASRGLGLALAQSLATDRWRLIIDARGAPALAEAASELSAATDVLALAGDVADDVHRHRLSDAVDDMGRLDLLVNNASTLGVSPQPHLVDFPLPELEQVYRINVLAPVALTQLLLPRLRASRGTILNISSDAAVEPYAGWGGYGSSKAALDHVSAILAAEEPDVRVYAVDPGDMRTELQQQAFPGEDISDRPEPDSVVPALLHLIERRPPSGRYRAAQLFLAGTGR